MQDRRRHGRLRCTDLACRFAGPVEDLSLSGLRVRALRPPPVSVGSRLSVTLESPRGTIEAKTRVVWVQESGPGTHEIGLEFEGMSRDDRRALFGLSWAPVIR